SSWRLARRAGRNGDSRARPSGHPRGTRDAAVRQVTRVGCCSCGSRRGGQVLGQRLGGCLPSECLSRATVERRGDSRELVGAVAGEVGASWEVLAQQPVGVLVRAALPRTSWIAEVDLKTG